jgi:hypothetical protein
MGLSTEHVRLRLRQAVLRLLERALVEVAAHKVAHGGDASGEAALIVALQADADRAAVGPGDTAAIEELLGPGLSRLELDKRSLLRLERCAAIAPALPGGHWGTSQRMPWRLMARVCPSHPANRLWRMQAPLQRPPALGCKRQHSHDPAWGLPRTPLSPTACHRRTSRPRGRRRTTASARACRPPSSAFGRAWAAPSPRSGASPGAAATQRVQAAG